MYLKGFFGRRIYDIKQDRYVHIQAGDRRIYTNPTKKPPCGRIYIFSLSLDAKQAERVVGSYAGFASLLFTGRAGMGMGMRMRMRMWNEDGLSRGRLVVWI